MPATPADSTPSPAGSLAGRVIIVLGAERSLGRALADAAGSEGARVVAAQTTAGGPELGKQVEVVESDLDNVAGLAQLAETTQRLFGPPEVVVLETPVLGAETTPPVAAVEWGTAAGRTLRRAWLASQAFLPGMLQRGRGVLLSLVMPDIQPGQAAFAAAQQGLIGLGRALAADVAGSGAHVLTLALPRDAAVATATRAVIYLLAHPEDFALTELLHLEPVLERAEQGGLSTGGDRASRLAQAVALAQQTASLLLDTDSEFDRLPVAVRPLARGAFASKVGYRSQDVLRAVNKLGDQLQRMQASHSGTDTEFDVDYPLLAGIFERLIVYYQAMPEEMARLSGDAALVPQLRRQMAEREALILSLLNRLAEVRA
jgi:NAD(P)-dependent dehydrogenase (short-subunit alcohol dehydrogenase family)